VNESNLAIKLDEYDSREALSDLSEEEQRIIAVLRDPVKEPKLREIMENSLKR
jgi:translation initiation factor 2 alpha subunit (eIF-2alpha)